MKSGVITALVAAAAIMGPMMVVAAENYDADSSDGKTFVKDSVITTKVKAKLAADHITSLGRIHVDTDADGVVWLSGTAQSQDAIDAAIQLTRDTEHVRGVHSDIKVRHDD
jgi:hyperosmotically inducible periplasmic protein